MDELQRFNLKFYLEDSASLSAEEAFRIFNTWIPNTPGEVLVDVADYSHVPSGPITLLVGHEANYCLDNSDDRPGLLYARKQPLEGDLAERFAAALKAALGACRRLEEDARVRFRADEVLVIANDRLRTANDEGGQQALQQAIAPVLKRLFGGAAYTAERAPDPRQRLQLRIAAQASTDIQTLLANLGT